MKLRWIIVVGLVALATGGAALILLLGGGAQRALEETRRTLRQQGFKIDLSEFDLSASAEQTARAAALTNADIMGGRMRGEDYARLAVLRQGRPGLLTSVGSNAAVVVWKEEKLAPATGQNPWMARDQAEEDLWPALRDLLKEKQAVLDAACAAALAGPIRFHLDARHGADMLLPHLMRLRNLIQELGTRTVLELHDGNRDAAWTNVLASARLVTAWEPEPPEVSHMLRCALIAGTYETTWQALQAGGWPDERLAQLQQEWEATDFFKDLPDTAAFRRASMAASCRFEREQPLEPSLLLRGRNFPLVNVWFTFIQHWRQVYYRHHGSFEDERAFLLYFRDRELELRDAVKAPTWLAMQQLAAVTNAVPFQSQYAPRMPMRLNPSQLRPAVPPQGQGVFSNNPAPLRSQYLSSTLMRFNLRRMGSALARQGQGVLSRAAEAEARRRLLVTAIALERYRGRHGGYPESLQALSPELLKQPLVDFMDGQPLRYRRTEDGHFVLYSVGLDCVDDGGQMRRPFRRGQPYPEGFDASGAFSGTLGALRGTTQGTDLVWPRPASAAEVQAQRQDEEGQADRARAALEEQWAQEQKQSEAERQAVIQNLLAEARARELSPQSYRAHSRDPSYQGRPLSQLLPNVTATETNTMTLEEMLTARQVITGQEGDAATFEVPVSYDAAAKYGRMHLVVDGGMDVGMPGEEGERQTCKRATNGNCLLSWTTTYDPPGKHVVQAEFIATKDEDKEEHALKVKGPPVVFVSTNVCQFSAAYDHFDARGATLYARLPESNGIYSIELKTSQGAHIKTLTGTTSNGVIKVHWDLRDDGGRRYTNDSFDSTFDVTLPGSGRSQKIKGP